MRVALIGAKELSGTLARRWSELQRANPELSSPYFAPAFLRAVAEVRDDVFVGVIEQDGEVAGFFPFQRQRLGMAGPVAGHLSDYQGLIAAADSDWDATELLRACRISVFRFDHLLASQRPFQGHHRASAESPLMDLRAGYESYVRGFKERGSQHLQSLARKARKLAREVGELSFELHSPDPALLERVIGWKRAQCAETGIPDVFSFPWTVHLLERILHTQEEELAGLLSVLRAGDQVVALHLGMRSRSVVHWWFPTYNHEFARYSPGLILLTRLAEQAAAQGLQALDLGKGDDFYKSLFRNASVALAEGRVALPSLAGTLLGLGESAEAWLRRTPLGAVARVPGRALRRLARKASLR